MEANNRSSYFGSLTFEQVLDDLSSRFIVNLPAEELQSIERVCFQIEQAHWYYEDFVRPQASHLPSFSLRKFSEIIFKTNPLLSDYDSATAYDHFLRYKERVPVCGAILISSNWDKCLLVKGWKSGASWSFPRGKINQGEEERDCAVREVWEETGYDISPHFNPAVTAHDHESESCPPPLPVGNYRDDDYLECVMKEQRIRLYIVPNVSEDTLFETKTRKEISKIAWSPFTNLPTWSKKNKGPKKELKCYMVTPFVNPLKQWVQTHRPGSNRRKQEEDNAAVEPVPVSEGAAVAHLSPHHDRDEQSNDLSEQTQALQEFLFGSQATSKNDAPVPHSYQPITQPKQQPQDVQRHFPATPATVPQYQQNSSILSPAPETPVNSADNLHRLLLQRGYEQQIASGPSTLRNAATISHSTIAPHSPNSHMYPATGSPSYTDYRNSALSPSSFAQQPSSSQLERGPRYTEQQREEARSDLLMQLASQLGSPTPPSADEGTDATDSSGQEESSSREASPALDLLALVHSQLQGAQPHTSYHSVSAAVTQSNERSSQNQLYTRQPSTQQLHSHSGVQHDHVDHSQPISNGQPSNPSHSGQSILQILNGNLPVAPASPKVSHPANYSQTSHQATLPPHPYQLNGQSIPINQGSKVHQTAALLSLFNTQQGSPTKSPEALQNGAQISHTHQPDLARLFSNMQVR